MVFRKLGPTPLYQGVWRFAQPRVKFLDQARLAYLPFDSFLPLLHHFFRIKTSGGALDQPGCRDLEGRWAGHCPVFP
jgi:hypothetical protein